MCSSQYFATALAGEVATAGVIENAQMCYSVYLVRYTGNPIILREKIIDVFVVFFWFKLAKISRLAETSFFCQQRPETV